MPKLQHSNSHSAKLDTHIYRPNIHPFIHWPATCAVRPKSAAASSLLLLLLQAPHDPLPPPPLLLPGPPGSTAKHLHSHMSC
jgi:hypothetical protein